MRLSGESTSIYSTASTDVPCLFCLAVPNASPVSRLVDLGGMAPNLVFRDLTTRKLMLQTPCYATTPTGTALIQSLPQRTLATFRWPPRDGTYIGPTTGLQDSWRVYDRE
jgi:hypothetical protein